jgi:hypothetical protein
VGHDEIYFGMLVSVVRFKQGVALTFKPFGGFLFRDSS